MSEDPRYGTGRSVTLPGPLRLDGGGLLSPLDIGYETYGTLAPDGGNAILVCHALTGDQHVASEHPRTGKPGWWMRMVGPGKPIDTDRYFVVCSNVLGSCLGSSGPATVNPATGKPWGMGFPVITIRDMVRAQAMLLDHLGVGKLFAVVGGSMGGMQALSWAATFPERVASAVVIASAARHSAQNIAFHEVGRQAVMADPKWRGGDYYGDNDPPAAGLAVARMAAHITYLSEAGLTAKFGRKLQSRPEKPDGAKTFGFDADFQVESYLRHQGLAFVDRFDANSYLYITRALDYFDLAEEHGGLLADAFRGNGTRFCVVSFDTDWLYPTSESRTIVHALNAAGARASFVELKSPFGHDAFDKAELDLDLIHAFLSGSYWAKGIPRHIVENAIRHSFCAAAFAKDEAGQDEQVGFARVITDHATFAYLADVFVLPAHRGKGVAMQMLEAVQAHPELAGLRRWLLFTRDMQPLYAKLGWTQIPHPERCMERHEVDLYTR